MVVVVVAERFTFALRPRNRDDRKQSHSLPVKRSVYDRNILYLHQHLKEW